MGRKRLVRNRCWKQAVLSNQQCWPGCRVAVSVCVCACTVHVVLHPDSICICSMMITWPSMLTSSGQDLGNCLLAFVLSPLTLCLVLRVWARAALWRGSILAANFCPCPMAQAAGGCSPGPGSAWAAGEPHWRPLCLPLEPGGD